MNPFDMTDHQYGLFLDRSVQRAADSWGFAPSGFFDLKSDHEAGLVNELGETEDEFYSRDNVSEIDYDEHTWTEAPRLGLGAAHMYAEGSEAHLAALRAWQVTVGTYAYLREAGGSDDGASRLPREAL